MTGQPEIISRGFIDRRDEEELLDSAKETIERAVKQFDGQVKDSTKRLRTP
ncbi:MAG: hypothetical protein H6656_03915 [Ardenticatenaceae bacterium]|nr:hypothetical protein [Ardenticatenaceae bacterium]